MKNTKADMTQVAKEAYIHLGRDILDHYGRLPEEAGTYYRMLGMLLFKIDPDKWQRTIKKRGIHNVYLNVPYSAHTMRFEWKKGNRDPAFVASIHELAVYALADLTFEELDVFLLLYGSAIGVKY